jgi:hypothetical protein
MSSTLLSQSCVRHQPQSSSSSTARRKRMLPSPIPNTLRRIRPSTVKQHCEGSRSSKTPQVCACCLAEVARQIQCSAADTPWRLPPCLGHHNTANSARRRRATATRKLDDARAGCHRHRAHRGQEHRPRHLTSRKGCSSAPCNATCTSSANACPVSPRCLSLPRSCVSPANPAGPPFTLAAAARLAADECAWVPSGAASGAPSRVACCWMNWPITLLSRK